MAQTEAQRALFWNNIRYYGVFQLIFVALVVSLSSIGAFFHFLLDHEISIVEAWLHNNQWEILILSKLTTLFLLNRWFKMRLYHLKSVRELARELVSWPEPKAVVVSIFMTISYATIGQTDYIPQNLGYWYHHMASFLGIFLFFGIEFIVIAYLEDVLNQDQDPPRLWLGLCFTAIFTAAFRLSVPDYYGLIPHIVLCYTSLIYLSGKRFKSWSNVVCFLVLFVAPMGSILGLDPVWGDDFSLFRVAKQPNMAFLAVIWVLSFSYYNYRDQIISSTRKLLR